MGSLIEQRLRKTQIYAGLLQALPFVNCVLLNGSLATGRAKQGSDIDLLIITTDRRIFTARFFVNSLLQVLGQKRPSLENKTHSGKFCPNYFLNESFLKIPIGRGEKIDHYCADNYSRSVLVAGDKATFQQFLSVNKALFAKSASFSSVEKDYRKILKVQFPIKPNSFVKIIKHLFETGLTGSFGEWLESKLKAWQIKKITMDQRTKKYPNLIVFNDKELRFHPPSGKF